MEDKNKEQQKEQQEQDKEDKVSEKKTEKKSNKGPEHKQLNEKPNNEKKNIVVFDPDKVKSEKQLDSEAEEKSKKYLYVAVAAVVLIFILLIAFVRWHSSNEIKNIGFEYKYTYNGFNFSEYQGTWQTKAYRNSTTLYEIYSRYGPKQLETIPVKGDITKFRQYKKLYITFDPYEENLTAVTMAAYELTTKLIPHFGILPIMACTENSTECANNSAPIITCNSTNMPVIYLSQTKGPEITVDGNCAVISGRQGDNIVMAADRFMYGMYGIMK